MKTLFVILLALATAACGGDDKSAPVSKDLFSLWTADDGSTIDLRDMSNGAHPIRFWFSPNSGCNCTVDIFGDQQNGTANLVNCSQFGPGSYCGGLEDFFGYDNTGGVLTLCGTNSGTCETYR